MKKLLYSSLAIAAMAVSCQEAELENNGAANNGEVFRIEVPISETKTVYTPPTKVTWATGDEITVIVNDTDANKFTNSEGNYFETTEFIPEAGTEYTYHAFYPYSSFVTSVDEAGKTDTWISVPSTASASQSGLNSTTHVQGVLYGDGTATGTEAPVIDMKHLTALLKIDVTNNYSEAITLRSITVSTNADGQYLSGRFDVNLNDGTLTPNVEQLDRCVSSSTLGISDGILETGATASFYLSTTEFTVPVGSTLTISAESDKGTAEDVRTYPQEMVFAAGTVNNTTFSFENPEQTIEKLTVAEFLAKDVDANTYYELTGTISNITNTEYGNFDLVDETGSVYVYGLTASKVASNDKSFSTLGLREGDILTLYGTRYAYNGDPQVGGPAYYISHVAVPYCDVTPSTLSVDAAEGTTKFAIESNESWEITSSNTSYKVSPASGEDDAEITVTYPANETDEAITVTFTVKSESGEKTVTLTQASVSATSVELLNETFTGLVGNNTDSNGANTAWNGNDNFPNVTKAYEAGDAVKIGASKNPSQGSITSKELTVPANSILTVSFDVKGWSSVEGDIEVTFNGETHAVEYTATMSGSFENKTTTFNVSTETVSSVTIGTTAKRAYIDNVIISYSK